MKTKNCFWLAVLAMGLAAGWSLSTAGAEPPATSGGAETDAQKAEDAEMANLQRRMQSFKNLTDEGTFQIHDLLSCTIDLESGRVNAQITRLVFPIKPAMVRAKVLGLSDPLADNAVWMLQNAAVVSVAPGQTVPAPKFDPAHPPVLTLARNDPDQFKSGQVWQTGCSTAHGDVSFHAVGKGINIGFVQHPASPTATEFNFMVGDKPVVIFTARSLLDLLAQHPAEVRQYLAPMLAHLVGRDVLELGPGDVYSVFPGAPADPAVAKPVADLLAPMNSDSPEKRETASAELAKLGTPGILAVLRLDRSKLSQEQKTRCDQFLRSGKTRDFDDPALAGQNVYFLLDAMNYPDAQIRLAAKKALETRQGHPLDVDVSASSDAAVRLPALDKLRSDYAAKEGAKATTQPG